MEAASQERYVMSDPRLSRALISVSDKTGLEPLARALVERGVMILSTGGTAKALKALDIAITDVSDVTGFPEIMDGRVKTLHPMIHGGILGRLDNPTDEAARESHGITPIDLVVVNLYPFEETLKKDADFETMVETIDIGGPAMIRAAAKNHAYVTVVTSPDQYDRVIKALDAGDGAIDPETRQTLAMEAFARTAAYDTAVSHWLAGTMEAKTRADMTFGGPIAQTLRYGENPHQSAALYRTTENRPGVASAAILQGKELSYNNLNDTDAAFEAVCEFDPERPAVVIVKHANPCGIAHGDDLKDAYLKARACDPVSAFGGIVALNGEIDGACAEAISEIFTEVIIAPKVSDGARAVFAKKPNLRVLETGGLADPKTPASIAKTIAGGLLVQDRDASSVRDLELKTVTKSAPTEAEMRDLKFAFSVAKHVKSNTIVYAKDEATVGIGAGQMSRVDAAHIAARKAADVAKEAGEAEPATIGSVVASDAFFPFADGLQVAIEAGATAVIQPGGSMRDDDVIAAADEAGVAMVFTGVRHFRH